MSESLGYDAAAVQILPTGDGIDIATVVAEALVSLGHPQIAEDIESRVRLGERKYAKRLKAFNGRDGMMDLYQEILDSLNYSKQCQLEGLDDGSLFDRILLVAQDVASKLSTYTAEQIESESH